MQAPHGICLIAGLHRCLLGLYKNMVPEAACSGGAKFYGQQHGNEILSRSALLLNVTQLSVTAQGLSLTENLHIVIAKRRIVAVFSVTVRTAAIILLQGAPNLLACTRTAKLSPS